MRETPRREVLAARAVEMRAAGASYATIAKALGTCEATAKEAVDFGTSAAPPPFVPYRVARRVVPLEKTRRDAEIVRLRDEELWSFRRIARHLGISHCTVADAYDRAHPEVIRRAASGVRPDRSGYRHLDRRVIETVGAMLRAGHRVVDIVETTGCSASTVDRERQRLGLVRKQ